jgi:hypothetical protein
MAEHVLAYVTLAELGYRQLKLPGSRRGRYTSPAFKANYYRSASPRLHRSVHAGDTLWVITSTPNKKGPNTYVLAYKLANCQVIPVEEVNILLPPPSEADRKRLYAVRMRDDKASYHFPILKKRRAVLSDDDLRRLRFTNAIRPIQDPRKQTVACLYNFPVLSQESAALLERLERKSRYGRQVVISYAHEDMAIAATIQHALEQRQITTFRDTTSLLPGQHWEEGLQEALELADAMLVLLSPHANASQGVQKEVGWALRWLDQPGARLAIVPILLPGMAHQDVQWERFATQATRRLEDFWYVAWPAQADPAFVADLAQKIAEASEER